MKKYASYIFLSLMILLITGSALWSPGAIILLDYIFTDNMPVDIWMPLWLLIPFSLTHIFSYIVVSKVFFILILIAAAYLGVLFGRWIATRFAPEYRTILEVFGGILLLVNPYAYERMMVQPGVYLSVIFLGYTIYYLYFSHRILLAGLFAGLALATMPHASYMIALIFGLYFVFFVRSWRILASLALTGVIALIVNLNWIIAPYFGHVSSIASISTFSPANMEAFRTQALAPLDVISTNILLYGFWGERYGNHYAGVGFLSSLWYVAGFLIFGIVLLGLWSLWKRGQSRLVTILSIIAILSLIFAIGIASPLTEGLALWMGQYIPLWQGYREPQKWIGLLMIVEGITFLVGFAYMLERWGRDRVVAGSLIFAMSLILLIWSPGPLMGYHGQLRTTVYPIEFEMLRSDLLAQDFTGRILALPWHSYIGCSWMGRPTVANPIAGLLAPLPVISSDNIEVADILYSNSQTEQSRDVEQFLTNRDTTLLQRHEITHIFLMRSCANSTDMETLLTPLAESGSLILQKETETYRLYQITSTQ